MGFGKVANTKEVSAPVAEVKEQRGNGPIDKIKIGGVTVDTWKNSGEHADFFTYSLQRNYKQGNEWKNTNSLRTQDLPKAILALQKAYEQSFKSEQDEKD